MFPAGASRTPPCHLSRTVNKPPSSSNVARRDKSSTRGLPPPPPTGVNEPLNFQIDVVTRAHSTAWPQHPCTHLHIRREVGRVGLGRELEGAHLELEAIIAAQAQIQR